MERSKRGYLANPAKGFVGNNLRLRKIPTTLNNTVANAVDLDIQIGKQVKNEISCSSMIGQVDHGFGLIATKLLVANKRTFNTNALAVTLCIDLAGVDIE